MFNDKEKATIRLGLDMYKKKLAKHMKGAEELNAGAKEAKQKFLDVEALIQKISDL